MKLDVENIVEDIKENKRDFTDEQKLRVEKRILDHLHSWSRDPSWRKAIEDSVHEALSDVVPEKAANLTSLLLRDRQDWNTGGETNYSHLKTEKLPDEDSFTKTEDSAMMDEAIKLANRAKNLRRRRSKYKRRKLSRPSSRSKIHTLSTMGSTGSNASSGSSNFGSPLIDSFDGLFSILFGFNPFNSITSMFVGSENESGCFQSGNSDLGRSGGSRNHGYRAGRTSSNCNQSSGSTSRKRKRHALDGYRLEPISDETIRLAVELLAKEGIGEAEDLVRNAAFGDYGDSLDEDENDDDVLNDDDLCDLCKNRRYPSCMKCRRFTMKSSRKTVKKSSNIHGFSA